MTCKHENVDFEMKCVAFGDTNLRYAEVTGRCLLCSAPMKFRCDQVGVSPDRPMVNLARQEATLPFMFGDEEYDGRAAAGFIVTRVQ